MEKLRSKNIASEEIKKTIKVLKRNELLDDVKFAKMWVGSRNSLKPSGNFLLKLELKNLGISGENIEIALAGQDEEKLARQALENKGRLKTADFAKRARFLQSRGFSMNIIYKTLRKNDNLPMDH